MNGATTELKLTALRTPISNGALGADKLPTRLKLANWGDNPSTKGNIRITPTTGALLPQRQVELGFDRIALDFEHNTVPGTDEYNRTQEPRPVAAYGVPRIVHGEGLFLDNIEWTPEGKKSALNYADLSPAVHQDENGNVDFIHSAGLVRNGAIHGLSFFSVTVPAKTTNNDPSKTMSEKFIALTALTACLGMPETTDEKAALGELKKQLGVAAGLSALSALIHDGKVVIPGLDDLTNRLKTLETAATKGIAVLSAKIDGKDVSFTAEDVVTLMARVNKLEKFNSDNLTAQLEVEKNRIIPLFAAEGKAPKNFETGKAYTADELRTLDLTVLRVLLANTPVTVPLSARNKAAHTDGKSELKGLAKAMAAHKAESNQ